MCEDRGVDWLSEEEYNRLKEESMAKKKKKIVKKKKKKKKKNKKKKYVKFPKRFEKQRKTVSEQSQDELEPIISTPINSPMSDE